MFKENLKVYISTKTIETTSCLVIINLDFVVLSLIYFGIASICKIKPEQAFRTLEEPMTYCLPDQMYVVYASRSDIHF